MATLPFANVIRAGLRGVDAGMDRDISLPPGRGAPVSGALPLIHVANADGATLGLLQEWLSAAGYRVRAERRGDTTEDEAASLLIVDVPFCRFGAGEVLRRVGAEHPDTPIIAMSATFFSTVRSDGACAHRLGVAAVVPKPIAREKLLAAVERLVHAAG
jgi:DNA-binding response OmpR family regulator